MKLCWRFCVLFLWLSCFTTAKDLRDSGEFARKLGRSSEEMAPKFKQSHKLERFMQRTAGSGLSLSCTAYGNPNITWFKNEHPLMADAGEHYKLKKWSLVMDKLLIQDSGSYKCRLCNSVGCIEHTTRLTVLQPTIQAAPVIASNSPENQTVLINDHAHFECKVQQSGAQLPHIVWFKALPQVHNITAAEQGLQQSGSLQNPQDFTRMISSEDEPHMLHLGSVQLEDEGWYSCVAQNSVGRTVRSGYLKVLQQKLETTTITSTTSSSTTSAR